MRLIEELKGFTPFDHGTNIHGFSDKLGLLCVGCHDRHYEALTPMANWTLNFRLFPQETFPVKWARDNDVEFVGFIPYQHKVEYNSQESCDMRIEPDQKGGCDINRLIETVKRTKDMGLRMEHLMAFNEAYTDPTKWRKEYKWIDPPKAAEFWGRYI